MIDIDDDFQESLGFKAGRKSFRALKMVRKPFYMQDRFKKPKGWVNLPIKNDETNFDINNATSYITEWAEKQHMILVKKKSTQTARYLTCKFSLRYDSKKVIENPERLTSSYKTGCSFIIRLGKIEKNGLFSWSLTEPIDGGAMEYTHNHPCTQEYNRITPESKKRLFTQDDVKNVVKMVENRTSIPEIRKNISTFNGLPVFEYQYMANLVNSLKGNIRPNSRIDDARVLIDKMKNAGYTVRYQVSQTKNGDPLVLKDVFFASESMIKNARKLGQVFIIDATYKTSKLEMPLVSVYGVHNILGKNMQLKTFPVAYAFVSQESAPSYKWFLQCLKDVVCPSNETPVFATDKCMALINALDIVFDMSDLFYKIVDGRYPDSIFLSCEAKHLIKSLLRGKPKKRMTAKDVLKHPWLTEKKKKVSKVRYSIFHPKYDIHRPFDQPYRSKATNFLFNLLVNKKVAPTKEEDTTPKKTKPFISTRKIKKFFTNIIKNRRLPTTAT